ncbi:amino acid adenylation domain protein [Clostridium cellulovorans 743B]|uniref:Amino acid adenylation domain protein n=1 Tax=Clostridium cellulovorans (strain ATCC 35296 / DSM 3052 / OCM 3 / 743B) TaxID=573061 RepID=D9SQJ5_CLOC7|nr:non-ribosomal peptide synthetase [Clostridium cellulovorans]ADL52201.1 amino acid adenylation domain protein [Clostridium cellulovorans 743B]
MNMKKKVQIKKIYPLTPMQQGMLFHALMDNESEAYFEQMSFDIKGDFSVELFEESFNSLIAKYDVLRTIFKYSNIDEPIQIVLKERRMKIHFEDIVNFQEEEKEQYIEAFKAEDRKKGFDLQKDILMRVSILKTAEDTYKIIWSHHHIIMDGWCLGIIVRDVFDNYKTIKEKLPVEVEEAYPFSNYINWLKKQDTKEALNFWKKRFEGCENETCIPKSAVKSKEEKYLSKEFNFNLDKKLIEDLKAVALASNVPVNTVYQGIWGILLQRYNNTEEAVFGLVVAGRPAEVPGIEEMMGLFINTVPVYVKNSKTMSFKELVGKIHEDSINAQSYEYCSLADIQAQTDLKQNLMDNILVIEDYPLDEFIGGLEICKYLGLEISNVQNFEQTNYDFNIDILPGENTVVQIGYNSAVYDSEFVKSIEGHFRTVAKIVGANPEVLVGNIEILTKEEKEKLLFGFNNVEMLSDRTEESKVSDNEIAIKTHYDFSKTLPQLFEENAVKDKDKTAVIFKDEKISYSQLNIKANKVARYLRKQGVDVESLVVVMLERSPLFIESVMGIWKAGGAYIPVDTNYPIQRKLGILEDSKANYVITKSEYIDEEFKANYKGNIICVDLVEDKILEEEAENLNIEIAQNNLAYVLFTSGSTGKPKGVMIEHMGMLNHIFAERDELNLDTNLVFAQNANQCFDISVWQFFGALALGGTTAIYPNDMILNSEEFTDSIIKDQVTLLEVVPSYLMVMMDYLEESKLTLENLKYLIITGEAVKPQVIKRWFELFPGIKMVNAYGPAEASDDVTQFIMDKLPENYINIPTGKPVTNMRIYIVDKDMRLCPEGVVGEICVAGIGVGRGYINDEKRTNASFFKDTFIEGSAERLYKTGDLGRWLSDGNIEFIGRNDFQVKIRGLRIELGEIESRLADFEAIKDAVVIDLEDQNGAKYLCAYFSATRNVEAIELKNYILGYLPEYMVPTYFIQLEELPLLISGKIDRKSLPKPESILDLSKEYVAAESETESQLVDIWQKILATEKIGVTDNFFDLGGHSLLAIRLISKINSELNKSISLNQLFSAPTIREMANFIDGKDKNAQFEEIKPVPEQEFYEVSSAQKRLFVINELNEEDTSYNMPVIEIFEGKFDTEKFQSVIKKLVARHEAFRTSFKVQDGNPVQIIHKEVDFNIDLYEAKEDEVKGIVDGFIEPFDLKNAPLLRVGIIKINELKHIIMIDMHHIISDGMSMDVFISEFLMLYKGIELKPLTLQYKDYSAWQNKLLKAEVMKKQEEFWLENLKGEIPVLNLPTDYSRPTVQAFDGDSVNFVADATLTERLRALATETGTTTYMMVLAAFNVLLHRYTGQDDIIIGSPIAGRTQTELEDIIGMFVNTLALRNFPNANKTFKEFVSEIKDNSLRAFENQDYQFEELIDKLQIKRDLSRNPLFDIMFVMQNTGFSKESDIKEFTFTPYDYEVKSSMFDITLNAVEDEKELKFEFEYCTKLFKKHTIENMSKHLLTLLKGIVENPNSKLADIEILDKEEKNLILKDFNNTEADYEYRRTLQELFEAQVEKTPNSIALIYGEEKLTYKELNEKVNKLAVVLRNKGVKPNDIVGIMVERSFEMIVGILGILKAGGAYMPMNPENPTERIAFMLEDSKANILLTKETYCNKDTYSNVEVVYLEDSSLYQGEAVTIENTNDFTDSAYVIYTSGSTGKPKGVLISHCSAVNILSSLQKRYPLNSDDTYLLKTAYTFDVSVAEIFGWYMDGGTLAILNQGYEKEPDKIIDAINKYNVTHINFVPSMFNLFTTLLDKETIESAKSLKYIFLAGEAVTPSIIEKYRTFDIAAKLENIYGPTEATIYSTAYSLEDYKEGINVPIGKPMENLQAYILGANDKLQPVGVIGELCIGGVGVAKGYLNNTELTNAKFVPNKFNLGTTIYRTGDIARWLPDGNIEYLGRIDHQVKIRGFRIELGEIEDALLKIEDIKEVIVLDKGETGNKFLCAYYVSQKEYSVGLLREELKKSLPDYMVPSYFIRLESMPLNQNGKVDRKALPEPEGKIDTGVEYEAPRNELEEKLVEMWQEVLGVKNIGINDNFFELGGHSLKATTLVGRIHKELGIQVPLKEVFGIGTIKGLSEYVASMENNLSEDKKAYNAIEKVEEKEFYEASSAQKRMYMLQEIDDDSTAYNLPGVLEIVGEIDVPKLNEVFLKLIERHEALRTSFFVEEDTVVQKVNSLEAVDFNIERVEAESEAEAEEKINDFIRIFNLTEAPLLRVLIISLSSERHIMCFDMHHIISDGASMAILTSEFSKLYAGEELEELKVQYKDYSAWQLKRRESEEFRKQEEYWLKEFSEEIPVLNMPTDYPRPKVKDFSGDRIIFELDNTVTEGLREIAKETGSTMYMVLLANLKVLLAKYSGQEDIVIGSPIAGRNHRDLENIIGMFVNTLAIRSKVDKELSFKSYLRTVKEKALKAYENQDYQFEELVEKLNIPRDMSRNQFFDVMFTMQNTEDIEIEMGDLTLKLMKSTQSQLNLIYPLMLLRKKTRLKLS